MITWITKIFSLFRQAILAVLISFIRLYKIAISPLFPDSCRFYPTCSSYAIHALKKYGVIKGLFKSVYRILRCNPLSKGGYDPA